MNAGYSKNSVIIAIALLMGSNAVTFYMYYKLSEKYSEEEEMIIIKKERNYYYNQCEVMQKSAEDLSSFRHDINTHIAVIDQLISKEKYNEAKEYMDQLVDNNKAVTSVYSQTGNIAVDSIMNYKLASIDRTEINISTEIIVPNKTNI